MDPLTYKVIHLAGVMTLFLGLGTALLPDELLRKKGLMFHGIGLVLILVAGFGLIAKLSLGFPLWIIAKLVIWFIMGALPVLGKKRILPPAGAWTLAIALGIIAAYLGVHKPF